jgi:hypothetical protein
MWGPTSNKVNVDYLFEVYVPSFSFNQIFA